MGDYGIERDIVAHLCHFRGNLLDIDTHRVFLLILELLVFAGCQRQAS